MATKIDKSVYIKIWQEVNSSNDPFIRTQKTIHWIQALLKREQLMDKQPQAGKQTNSKNQKLIQPKDNKQKNTQDNKLNDQKQSFKNNPKVTFKNNPDSQINQKHQPREESPKKQQPQQLDNYPAFKQQITQQVILQYIKKYPQTDQYKIFCKSQEKPSELQPIKQEKEKKTFSKQISKKATKKTQPKIPEIKLDQNLILLTYEEAIFFYFWFKKVYQKDQKQRFLEKIKKEQQNYEQQQLQLQGKNEPKSPIRPIENIYQPKNFIQLTQRQMSYINEQSFISLKQHEPKLSILFKHYAKLSHVLTKQIFTFEERNSLSKIMTLHQWMIFCKEWEILSAKNINEGWESGKVTREFLVEIYYKNSFLRKEMSFQMFMRAIILVSCRMYQDCDVYKVKPIDLMLNFLYIKNQKKFIQKLEDKNISYRQGDILSCFKMKDRDVYEKMSIIRVTGNGDFKKSHFSSLRQKKHVDRITNKEVDHQSHNGERNKERDLERIPSELNLRDGQQNVGIDLDNETLDQNYYSTGNSSKLSLSRRNRKSAPQIGLKLPSIQNNKFFTPIPQNNHLNKFKQYIEKQVPESSSVLRNKITGYHKIHAINSQQEEQRLGVKNRAQHLRISKIIDNKLQSLMAEGQERLNPEKLLLTEKKQPSQTLIH